MNTTAHRRKAAAARRISLAVAQEEALRLQHSYRIQMDRISRGFGRVLDRMGRMLETQVARPGELEAMEEELDRLWANLRHQRQRVGLATPEP